MPWTKILLSDSQFKGGEVRTLLNGFRSVFHKEGMPSDMALFSGPPTETGYHPFYLTPACAKTAQKLIDEYSGTACEKPAKDELGPSMEIGFNKGWDMLR